MPGKRGEIVAHRVTQQRHQDGYRYQAGPVKRRNNRRRRGGTDIGCRRDCDAVHIDPEELRAGNAKGAVNEDPDEGTQ